MKKLRMLFRWLMLEKRLILKIYLLAIIQALMYISIPLSIQGVYTFIMAGQFSASLVLLSTVTILLIAFIGFFQIWQMRINETLHQTIFGQIASKMNEYVNRSGSPENTLAGINKFGEIAIMQKSVSKILMDLSFSVLSIITGLLLLPVYSMWFLLFTIVLCLAFYFIISYYLKRAISTNIEVSDQKYRLMELFQSYAGPDKKNNLNDQSNQLLNLYLDHRKSHYTILESQSKAILVFKIFFIALLLFFGTYLVHIGELNIGQFIASEIIIFLVINAVEKLINSLSTFYDLITSIYKVESTLNSVDNLSLYSPKENQLAGMNNIYNQPYARRLRYLMYLILASGFSLLFMPWTQNIQLQGKVTTLRPENRPQTVVSRISGRIEKWFISEGDYVKRNDTIAFISEIKDEYFDPMLIDRSEDQVKAKETTLISYEQKINAINVQIDALNNSMRLKTEQARNKIDQAALKVASDSIDAQTSQTNYKVAEEQFKRYQELLSKGVISQTDLENRKVKVQDALTKKISAYNKYQTSKNELLNAEIELSSVQQEYQEKLMKAESDKFSSLSMLYEGQGSLTKLQNQLANYNMRKSFYYVLAPQDGYITKTQVQGLGEVVKEGGILCTIVPKHNEQVVELFVQPMDLPLIATGQKVQLIFDGWPAFTFSGWPGVSYGTYEAEIVAFDRIISENGKFRVLAKNSGKQWPDAIQIGGGVQGFALLGNVPVFYELWRKINGFPPEYYQPKNISETDKTQKK